MYHTSRSFLRLGSVTVLCLFTSLAGCGDTQLGSKRDAGVEADMPQLRADAGDDASTGDSKVAGTAKKAECASTTPAEGSACAGYYCGTDAKAIAAESAKDVKCDPSLACTDDATPVVGSCAREVSIRMPAADRDALRDGIAACVYEDPALKDTIERACLDCFLDVIECGSRTDTCLVTCADHDGPECDACLQAHDCVQPFFRCAGLPSPF